MQAHQRQRWLELCAQAAMQEDPDHLAELAQEIARLLEDEVQRLRQNQPIRLAS
jgi:hypothetical protein